MAAHWVHADLAAAFGLPEALCNHLLAHGFNRKGECVLLAQFLGRQRRAEIGVARASTAGPMLLLGMRPRFLLINPARPKAR
ncbi:MAG: hypothetical protein RL610_1324 [Pseudomonadota bacterium]